MANYHTLRLILGDQLNAHHSWYQTKDSGVLYLIAELKQETDYVAHHVQKVCAFFAAMQGFANALKQAGHQVLHLTLDDSQAYQDLPDLLMQVCQQHGISQLQFQRPDEYRLRQQLINLQIDKVNISEWDSEHFLVPFCELGDYFAPNKHVLMEGFYRKLRKRFNLLIEDDGKPLGGKPLGGKWNYDAQNRNKFKSADLANIPAPLLFDNPIEEILARLKRHQINTIGEVAEHLPWPINRKQSLALLDFFCQHCLPNFGQFQDAMTANSPHQWSLYHSRLSFALNAKILHPMQVIQAAISAFEQRPEHISLAQVEGFVRQILGWREYVRGVYWANMPYYSELNSLDAQRALPAFYWHGNTKMNCMGHAIKQSLETSYAHHIQRLMITGNFALLTGIHPDAMDEWYLGIYIDAIEWVEMPNTRGMSQFADGGIIATKPYAASGNYINKMSDYCKGCHYQVKQRDGEGACPFNSLYWQFMIKHRARLANNPRIGMVYRNWDKQTPEQQQSILAQAQDYLANIDDL
ncbi:cryptochrome/photolyase family protein [Motilimonas sp. 1_MG-2023]|uniref:cryptochrome/photolyase family protein n=1 Tax=Motilimonas sp. 1_MG-2023 TaxID=3062672 RepID=UPI0026E1EBF2|nr:cryptochrome/photolyase family protein [Motilimonas sp. 1_MG-2023]MDO6524236.1 cryptochrome/photolyase family protein [Motilimonas sp. 1_MG-2023]